MYADQHAHDVAWMTAAEREQHDHRMADLLNTYVPKVTPPADPFAGIPGAHEPADPFDVYLAAKLGRTVAQVAALLDADEAS